MGDMLFPLGQVVATPGIMDTVSRDEVMGMLYRHSHGDWGNISEEDADENEIALVNDFRLFSAYTSSMGVRVWVITEADRSCTTVLLPEEY